MGAAKFDEERVDVNFAPLENGVDYLQSVLENLTWKPYRARSPKPGPRQLKYAVLHLQAAAEVLLKARLTIEHWSLVFEDPVTATRRRFKSGDFKSCTTGETVRRLRVLANVGLEGWDEPLKLLSKSRNALQHYGLTGSLDVIETQAYVVLDLLISFAHRELLPRIDISERYKLDQTLYDVASRLAEVKKFVTSRLLRLQKGELKGHESWTIKCPICNQWTLVIGRQDRQYECRLCLYEWHNVDDLPGSYAREILGISYRHDDHPATVCQHCGEDRAVLGGVTFADSPEIARQICLKCGKDAVAS